jgi:hypothetical protein
MEGLRPLCSDDRQPARVLARGQNRWPHAPRMTSASGGGRRPVLRSTPSPSDLFTVKLSVTLRIAVL